MSIHKQQKLEPIFEQLERAVEQGDDSSIRQLAKQFRLTAELGSIQFASILGCSDQTWYRLEAEKVGYSRHAARRMAKFLPKLKEITLGGFEGMPKSRLLTKPIIEALAASGEEDSVTLTRWWHALLDMEKGLGAPLDSELATTTIMFFKRLGK